MSWPRHEITQPQIGIDRRVEPGVVRRFTKPEVTFKPTTTFNPREFRRFVLGRQLEGIQRIRPMLRSKVRLAGIENTQEILHRPPEQARARVKSIQFAPQPEATDSAKIAAVQRFLSQKALEIAQTSKATEQPAPRSTAKPKARRSSAEASFDLVVTRLAKLRALSVQPEIAVTSSQVQQRLVEINPVVRTKTLPKVIEIALPGSNEDTKSQIITELKLQLGIARVLKRARAIEGLMQRLQALKQTSGEATAARLKTLQKAALKRVKVKEEKEPEEEREESRIIVQVDLKAKGAREGALSQAAQRAYDQAQQEGRDTFDGEQVAAFAPPPEDTSVTSAIINKRRNGYAYRLRDGSWRDIKAGLRSFTGFKSAEEAAEAGRRLGEMYYPVEDVRKQTAKKAAPEAVERVLDQRIRQVEGEAEITTEQPPAQTSEELGLLAELQRFQAENSVGRKIIYLKKKTAQDPEQDEDQEEEILKYPQAA